MTAAAGKGRADNGISGISGFWPLVALLALTFVLRIVVQVAVPHVIHPDETYQVIEPAWSFYGRDWIRHWEWRSDLRGWLWPGIVAAFAWPGEKLIGTAGSFLGSVLVLMTLLSLAGVWAAYATGCLKSRAHGIAGGFVAAVWYECIMYSPHPLNEAVAANLLMLALYFLARPCSWRGYVMAGAMLGACFIFRIQLSPALGFLALYYAGLQFRERWLPLVIGGLLPLIAYGAVDWITYGVPFRSMYVNFTINLLQSKASEYGVHPPLQYLYFYANNWFYLLPVVVLLVYKPRPPFQTMLYTALIILVSHSFIPHKEYRFVFPATFLLVVLAAYNSVDFAAQWREKMAALRAVPVLALVCAFWAANSLAIAMSPRLQASWSYGNAGLKSFRYLAQQKDMCGLGLFSLGLDMVSGSAGLHNGAPIYQENPDFKRDEQVRFPQAYNYLLVFRGASVPSPFSENICFDGGTWPDFCIYHRAGTCTPQPEALVNEWLKRMGR